MRECLQSATLYHSKYSPVRPIALCCSTHQRHLRRLNFSVFQNGERVKNISQKGDGQGFGTVKLALAPGSYELVIVAHNSIDSATLTAPTEITFPSNRVIDTFYYYGTLTIGEQPATTTSPLYVPLPSSVSFCATPVSPPTSPRWNSTTQAVPPLSTPSLA